MDRILVPPGGWACPGILLDGSDCGYEIGVVRAAPVDEVAEVAVLRVLVAEILDAVEAVSDRAGMGACVAVWRERARQAGREVSG